MAEFTAVVPRDYQRVMEIMRAAEAAGRDVDDAVMSALTAPVRPTPGGARRWPVPDPNGFLRYDRQLPARRPVPVRIKDWREVYPPAGEELIREQATRCMDCGIPFCHDGCPLGNRIPDWNDLVRTGDWDAGDRVAARHQQLPGVHRPAVPGALRGGLRARHRRTAAGDHQAGRGGDHQPRRSAPGWSRPQPAPAPSGQTVAVVGSGPAGLAAAQQLARAGHAVTVYERDDAIGGLLRYGIPDFKLEKQHIDAPAGPAGRRGRACSGPACNVGVDVTAERAAGPRHDAVLLACGALAGRDTPDDARAGRCAACTWRWTHLVAAPTGCVAGAAATRASRSTRPASTWSSSAAATPRPTASAWPTGRARPA